MNAWALTCDGLGDRQTPLADELGRGQRVWCLEGAFKSKEIVHGTVQEIDFAGRVVRDTPHTGLSIDLVPMGSTECTVHHTEPQVVEFDDGHTFPMARKWLSTRPHRRSTVLLLDRRPGT